jgi:BASS family bile acid:Na+ symporter
MVQKSSAAKAEGRGKQMSLTWMLVLKVSLVFFMAGNLLDMGLRLNIKNALRGLGNGRFVALTLFWGFVFGPGVAYLIARIMPLDAPYALGLVLMGMTPCAPFLPMLAAKAKADLGYTAAFMLLTAVGTIAFMPFAIPYLAKGMTVSAWSIARPLIAIILLPLAIGMVILRASPASAAKWQPVVKKVTVLFTASTMLACLVVYGQDMLGVAGSFAVISLVLFFLAVTVLPYRFGFGLPHEQKIVLSLGMATRNLGAAFAPLVAAPFIDKRATVMVVLGIPLMILFAAAAAKWFKPDASGV